MSLTRKNALITVFWSGLSTLQFFLRSIFFVSLFLKYRSQLDYGFWIILMSFYAFVVYVCDGYVRYCLNEYNLEYHRDPEPAAKNFRNGLAFLSAASLVILVFSFILLQYLPVSASLFNTNALTIRSYELQYCLLIVMAIGLAHCITKYIGGAIEPEGKIHIGNRYVAICGISETALYFICVWAGFSFINIFLAMLLLYTLINAVYLVSLIRKHDVYRNGIMGSVKGGIPLFARSLFFIANNFFEKLTQDGINFIIAFLYLPVLLPVYATTRTMANVMVTSGNTFISVFTIEFQRLSITKEVGRLLKILQGSWLFLGFFVNFGLICCYPLLMRIYDIWTHGKLATAPLFFFAIFSAVVFNVFGSVIVLYLKSLNAIRALFPVSVFRALFIFFLAVVLPKEPIYLAMSLLIAEFLVNVIFLGILLYRDIKKMSGINVAPMLLRSILPFAVTAVYLPLNACLAPAYLTATLTGCAALILVYIIQLSYLKNDYASYGHVLKSVLQPSRNRK